MKRALLDALLAARAEKRPVVLLTRLSNGEQWLHDPQAPSGTTSPQLLHAAQRALSSDRSGTEGAADEAVFVQAFNPPLRLLLIGAVHIAQALAPMASLSGFEVTVVDPRRSFATDQRFPGLRLDMRWPDEALAELAPDARTAVVTLTHDPKLDDPALHVALRSAAFYIGCLGSKRTHAGRLSRLKRTGIDDSALSRLHAPVGLAIGARSPAEIAVSILAQIVSRLRGGEVA